MAATPSAAITDPKGLQAPSCAAISAGNPKIADPSMVLTIRPARLQRPIARTNRSVCNGASTSWSPVSAALNATHQPCGVGSFLQGSRPGRLKGVLHTKLQDPRIGCLRG